MKVGGHLTTVLVGIGVLALAAVGYGFLLAPDHANACGVGTPGGQGYVPQQRYSQGPSSSQGATLTQEQAFDIASNHVKRLNPSLSVGNIKDAGPYYDIEIRAENNRVIERFAVDKQSGNIRPIY